MNIVQENKDSIISQIFYIIPKILYLKKVPGTHFNKFFYYLYYREKMEIHERMYSWWLNNTHNYTRIVQNYIELKLTPHCLFE